MASIEYSEVIESSDFFNILRQILDKLPHEEQVRFALECVKDVIHLNTDRRIITCVRTVEKWLKNKSSVSKKQLISASAAAYAAANAAANAHAAAAAYAANAAANAHAANAHAAHAAISAVYAAHTANADDEIFVHHRKKMQLYIAKAIALTGKRKNPNVYIKMTQNFDYNDPVAFFGFLDQLQENGQQIFLPYKDRLRLHLPKGYDIVGSTINEIIDQIMEPQNKWIIRLLVNIFS